MKTILVTGGVGFIGTNVCKRFLDEGYHVVAFDNLQRNGVQDNLTYLRNYKSPGQFEFVWGDVRNQEDLYCLDPKIKYGLDGIIWLAANPGIPRSLQDPIYDFKVNALGTLHGLSFANTHGKIPFLFASTNKVYSDKINHLPMDETPTRYVPKDIAYFGNDENGLLDSQGDGNCHSPYGVSKLAADQYVQEFFGAYDVPTVVNRMSCIYGLHQQGSEEQGWVDGFIRSLLLGDGKLNIFGTGKQVRDMLDGRDVAELYYQEFIQIDKVKGKVFNVGGGRNNTVSLFEAIEAIEQRVGKKFSLTFLPKRVGDHDCYISNIFKVQQALNWSPKFTFRQSVTDMIAAYRETIK